jgi:hypothetical protein
VFIAFLVSRPVYTTIPTAVPKRADTNMVDWLLVCLFSCRLTFDNDIPVATTVLAHNVFSILTGSSPSLSTF